ncbi:MAG: glycoside hydrolase family 18 protein [Desulfurella sp.]
MKLLALVLALFLIAGCSYQQNFTKVLPSQQPAIKVITQKSSSKFIIVGFYPYWEQSKYPPDVAISDNINLLYNAFVWPDSSGNLVIPKKFKNKEVINAAENKNIKVILSVGGGNTSNYISNVLNNPQLFTKFASQLVNFVKENNYSGIDIDWEFPKNSTDTANLDNFVQFLRQNLGSSYIISIDLPYSNYFGRYFDIDFLKNYVNYFVVMTYDYSGAWSRISGYNAPLKSGFCNPHDIQKSVEYWLTRGIKSKSMLLGIPFYGRAFNADEPCQEFDKSYAATYRNILSLLQNDNYQYFWDFMTRTPYLINKKDKIYYSFDDPSSIADKINYAFKMNLGGVAIWEITQDIINNHHTLLSEIARTVKNIRLLDN